MRRLTHLIRIGIALTILAAGTAACLSGDEAPTIAPQPGDSGLEQSIQELRAEVDALKYQLEETPAETQLPATQERSGAQPQEPTPQITAIPSPQPTPTPPKPTETPDSTERAPNTATPAPEPTPTPAARLQAKEHCDQLLKDQLVFTRGASTATRMNEVIRTIQTHRQTCAPELWNPQVDDSPTGVVAANGTACFSANAASNRNSVGNTLVPHGLRTGYRFDGPVRVTSGRDSDNNIIVYWALAQNRPADNALCWLFLRRLNTWTSNYPGTGTRQNAETMPTPYPTSTPAPAPTPDPRKIGGPGAIYRGDGNWAAVAGPAVRSEYQPRNYNLGDEEGQVPLDAIVRHHWIFESDYYRSLVQVARLNDPTELTSSGENINLQFVCVNRTLYWCQHISTYFAHNVAYRTKGQVRIEITSFPELGISGTSAPDLLAQGFLDIAELYSTYISREYPSFAIQDLWGIWPDDRTRFEALVAMAPEFDRIVKRELNAEPLFRNWTTEGGLFIFGIEEIQTPDDFVGLRTELWCRAIRLSKEWEPFTISRSPAYTHTSLNNAG